MAVKSAVMLTLFFGPLVIANFGLVSNTWILFLLYMISGLGMAGIGMGVMHDAIHGSYSRKRWINQIMGNTITPIQI